MARQSCTAAQPADLGWPVRSRHLSVRRNDGADRSVRASAIRRHTVLAGSTDRETALSGTLLSVPPDVVGR